MLLIVCVFVSRAKTRNFCLHNRLTLNHSFFVSFHVPPSVRSLKIAELETGHKKGILFFLSYSLSDKWKNFNANVWLSRTFFHDHRPCEIPIVSKHFLLFFRVCPHWTESHFNANSRQQQMSGRCVCCVLRNTFRIVEIPFNDTKQFFTRNNTLWVCIEKM